MKDNSYISGVYFEFIAKWYLRFHGYKIIQSRYITGRGTNASEIDIIAIKKDTLVFIEVKKRRTTRDALEAITYTAQERLKRSAEIYIKRNCPKNINAFRFDVITFDNKHKLVHHKNAIRN